MVELLLNLKVVVLKIFSKRTSNLRTGRPRIGREGRKKKRKKKKEKEGRKGKEEKKRKDGRWSDNNFIKGMIWRPNTTRQLSASAENIDLDLDNS